MIRAILIVNQQGKPRLVRFYDGSVFDQQQYLLKKIHYTVVERNLSQQSSIIDGTEFFGLGTRLVYRNFATLYFIAVVDEAESELAVLDLIQVYVHVLNTCFENVCELDIVFNFDKVNYILDELIVGGMVADMSLPSIMQSVNEMSVFPTSHGSAGSLGKLLSPNSLATSVFRFT